MQLEKNSRVDSKESGSMMSPREKGVQFDIENVDDEEHENSERYKVRENNKKRTEKIGGQADNGLSKGDSLLLQNLKNYML